MYCGMSKRCCTAQQTHEYKKQSAHIQNMRQAYTHGIETRADMRRTEQLVSKTKMSTLRSLAGFTRWNMKRNDEIRQICDVQNELEQKTKKRMEPALTSDG